jgi:hypothetical protein
LADLPAFSRTWRGIGRGGVQSIEIIGSTALDGGECLVILRTTIEGHPSTSGDPAQGVNQPIGGSKPVTTTIVKRCPDGYELVIRANGGRGRAKDIVPAND